MGNFREKNRENVREVRERGAETTERGNSMAEDAEEIAAILEGIDLQDSEDIEAVEDTGRSYQGSFDAAFESDIESAGQEVQEQSEEIHEAVGDELGAVRSGIGKLEQAGGVSEIGRDAAETGKAKLESGADEYEGIIADTEDVKTATAQKVEELKRRLGGTF